MKSIGSVLKNPILCPKCKVLYEFEKSDWIAQHELIPKERKINNGYFITDDYRMEWKELRCPRCNSILMKTLVKGHWDKPDCSIVDVPQDLDENYEYSLL